MKITNYFHDIILIVIIFVKFMNSLVLRKVSFKLEKLLKISLVTFMVLLKGCILVDLPVLWKILNEKSYFCAS